MHHKVLGLDGSLSNFGMTVVTVDFIKKSIVSIDELVLSTTSKAATGKRSDDDFLRFRQHWLKINELTDKYNIQKIYGEIPAGAQDARASFAFGGVTSMLSGLSCFFDVQTVTPIEVKVATTGVKYADKEDVISAVHTSFPDADWIVSKRKNKMNITNDKGLYLGNSNEHLADAVGTVLAGLKK